MKKRSRHAAKMPGNKTARQNGRQVDRAAMARAVEDFLAAAGLDVNEPNLRETSQRVTDAWTEEFLAGYGQTAKEALADRFPVSKKSERELVVVTDLHFRSMCPHHLMPYSGTAHLAYVPGAEVVGFGRLSALIDVFAHRLILQEELARQVALALQDELGTQGAACLIRAEQTCFRLRGEEQHAAVTYSEAYEGVLKEKALRAELWHRVDGLARAALRRSPSVVARRVDRAARGLK